MNQQELIKIIQTQKAAGKTVEEILSLGANAGFAPVLLKPLVDQIYHGEHTPDHFQNENSGVQFFWDPVGQRVAPGMYRGQIQKLIQDFQKLKKHPYRIWFKTFFHYVLMFTGLGVTIWLFAINIKSNIQSDLNILYFISTALIGFFCMGFMWQKKLLRRIRSLERDIVKSHLAETAKDWEYSPKDNHLKYKQLAEKFPELISDTYQKNISKEYQHYLSDQIWGKLESLNFYACLIEHREIQETSYDIRGQTAALWFPNDKYRVTLNTDYKSNYNTVYAVQIHHQVDTPFLLTAKSNVRAWLEKIGIKDNKNLELIDFNKLFKFETNAQYDLNKWFKLLTPVWQWELAQLAKKEPGISILVKGDALVIIRDGRFFDSPPRSFWRKIITFNWRDRTDLFKTNFFRKVKVDQRDIDYFQQKIQLLTELSQKLPKIKG